MLYVDTASAIPPFEQLRLQLVAQIERGELPPGNRLPTVRRLAADLGLAPNTVARTYRQLGEAGMVRTAGRRGTVVAERSADVGEDARRSAAAFVQLTRTLGMNRTDALNLVRQAFDT